MSDPTSYLLERAWVDGAVHDDVLVEIEDGRFTSVDRHGLPRFEGLQRPERDRFTGDAANPVASPA